jgi:Protein of unknown function (DUF2937)
MGATHRTIILAGALIGGAALSQAPEFTQQYRQRLGGAMAELQHVLADFDRDARANNLSREKALGLYAASPEKFLNDRGNSIRRIIDRYGRLARQNGDFASVKPVWQPFSFIADHDGQVWSGAWHDFQPGLPLTLRGAVWAGIGALFGAVLIWFPAPIVRGVRRRWRRRRRADFATDGHPDMGEMR